MRERKKDSNMEKMREKEIESERLGEIDKES